MGNWNRHFVRVGSDGNVQAFDTKGLEFLKTIPSEQLLSKNNILDDGSGNMTTEGLITSNLIYVNKNNEAGNTGGKQVLSLYNQLQTFPSTPNSQMFGFGMSGYTLENYTADNFNFWQVNFSVTQPAFSIGGGDNGGGTQFLVKTANNILDNGAGNMSIGGKFIGLNSLTGAMNGMPLLSGSPDLRTGVTAADTSPITIYSSTVSGTRYEVKARILATAGSSATYTISWTEGGVAQTVALTITAVDTEVHDNFVIAPDSGTNITAQITSLTSSTVNVDAIVSVLG